jgi:hypothetical protein
VVILRASGSRAFRAAALIASVAVAVDLAAVIDLVVEDSVVAVIDLVAAGDLEAVALGVLVAAAADSGAGAEN